jgi:hypothetical protein
MLVKGKEPTLLVLLVLPLNRLADQEDIARLQVLRERIDGDHLAGANGERPVLRHPLELTPLQVRAASDNRHANRRQRNEAA